MVESYFRFDVVEAGLDSIVFMVVSVFQTIVVLNSSANALSQFTLFPLMYIVLYLLMFYSLLSLIFT